MWANASAYERMKIAFGTNLLHSTEKLLCAQRGNLNSRRSSTYRHEELSSSARWKLSDCKSYRREALTTREREKSHEMFRDDEIFPYAGWSSQEGCSCSTFFDIIRAESKVLWENVSQRKRSKVSEHGVWCQRCDRKSFNVNKMCLKNYLRSSK